MPELPDITVYIEALERRVVGKILERVEILDLFVLRTARPPIDSIAGHAVRELRRLGKRIAFGFDDGKWLVLHLMVAGRLQWNDPGAKPVKGAGRNALARFHFSNGTLTLTEAGTKHRASLHLLADESDLAAHDRGGIDVFAATAEEFRSALVAGNHTLKRALTDPTLFSGIGNAYSDEILHAAGLSPVTLAARLTPAQVTDLNEATKRVLREWTERLRRETGDDFPAHVTAFRPEMAVHGKFGQRCPVCGTVVQRIRYADNEVNYCPRCQTGGKMLADRSLSRLLNKDWPKTIEEWEDRRRS
ncbi:MAG TPA: DNA-formamidopyrimidine glycosylase family protein [Candidatus Didemnitutus sp.]|nr:DNA-formamidopyrimidine glycosylase family protein [Candidatus Didemnitutus sp.]